MLNRMPVSGETIPSTAVGIALGRSVPDGPAEGGDINFRAVVRSENARVRVAENKKPRAGKGSGLCTQRGAVGGDSPHWDAVFIDSILAI